MTLPWPLFSLRIRTPIVELRSPTDDDLGPLLDVARGGVHPPDAMPFIVPWTDLTGPAFDHGFLRYYWGARASWSPDDWNLLLAAFVDGHPVGVQSVGASRFGLFRAVKTGSWLGLPHQNRGLGTEMRRAVLHLCFEGLGAEVAYTGAFEGNPASARVSEKLGYTPYGEELHAPRGVVVREQRYRLDRATWSAHRRDDVELLGLDRCLGMFGALPASVP